NEPEPDPPQPQQQSQTASPSPPPSSPSPTTPNIATNSGQTLLKNNNYEIILPTAMVIAVILLFVELPICLK
ncbi:4175_t:CDS:2, partial [Entrophospora sp. SA101]